MTERFNLIIDSEWWIVEDYSIRSDKYRDDLNGDDIYRGLKEGELTEKETVDLLNNLYEENERLKHENDKFVDVIAKKSQQAFLTRKENKQLKQQLQSILKLTRKIEDCTHDIKMIGDFE